MERLTHKEKLTLQVSLALAAGMVSTMPVTYGAPILDKVVAGGATVNVGTTTKVASTQTNNVIDWKDFSVAQGEKIEFDGGAKTNNYLNIVTGDVQSHINGEMKGGKDVYIVNPKGVIFGNGAQVDVGNLYVSTTQTDKVNTEAFIKNNGSPLQNTAASATADVINMGQIAADSVSIEGGTIKFLDTAKVTAQAANVTLKANTAIKLGHDYSTAATTPGYTMTNASGVALTPSAFATITTAEQLQNLSANQKNAGLLSGDYELGADIDLQKGSLTPIGGNGNGAFSGTFDGNFFEVRNFTANGTTNGGLFGDVTGTIQHLGVVNETAAANLVGGIAGRLGAGGMIRQSYVKNSTLNRTSGNTHSGSSGANGGIVGILNGGTIEESYSKDITALGGAGIAGYIANGGKIYNVYNTETQKHSNGEFFGIYDYQDGNSENKVVNAFTDDNKANFTSIVAKAVNLKTTDDMTQNASDYSGWTVNGDKGGKAAVSKYGGEDTIWRIYDGQSLPLLRCFLTARGTKLVDYKYNFFHNSKQTNAGKLDADGLTTANPANVGLPQAQQKALSGHSVGEDLTLVYNGDNFKTVDDDNQPLNPYAGDSLIQSVGTDAVKNAGSYTLFYGGQDGYDLVGNYLTINKKTLDLTGTPVQLKRVYDGTPTLTIKDIGSAVGVVEGDDAHIDNLTATLGTTKGTVGHYTSEHKGQTDGITIANEGGKVKISGTDRDNYQLLDDSANKIKIEADIEKRSLYLKSNQDASIDKYYDGTADTINAPTDIIQIDTDNQKEDKRGYVSGLVQNDKVGLNTTGVKTGYVDNDGKSTSDATDNPNASARGAKSVRYSNITLDTEADAANYQLVDTDGNVFKDNSAYYDATGSIKQRVLNVNTFVVKDKDGNAAKAEKTYDGTSTYTVADGSVITAAEATDAGKEGDKGEGIISADYPNIVFSAKTGEFQDANGNATVDATDSGYTDAATQVGYHAQASVLNGASESILGNYTLNDKTLQTNTDYDVKGEGRIDRLALTVGMLKNATGIDKTYDGNDKVVGSQYTTFGNVVGYTSDNHIVDTDTGLQWTIAGTYQVTDGDGGKAQNVRIANGKPAAKDINFDVTLAGTHAQNYTLNGTDIKTGEKSETQHLTGATGTINPVHLKNVQLASDADIHKTYDTTTTAGVADGDTDKLTLAKVSFDGLVQGDSKGDILTQTVLDTLNKNGNYYTADGKTADANVARDKDGKVTTKLVKYTGLTSGSNNYVFDTDTVAGQGTIKPLSIKDVSLAKTQAITKVYDGTSTVARDAYTPQGQQAQTAQNFVGDLSTEVNGQTIKLDYTLKGANYVDDSGNEQKNVGKDTQARFVLKVSMQGNSGNYSLDGGAGANYTLDQDGNVVKDLVLDKGKGDGITARNIYARAALEPVKDYDGTTVVKKNGQAVSGADVVTLTGLLDADKGDNASTALYTSKDVVRNKDGSIGKQTVNYTVNLDGDSATNYEVYLDSNPNVKVTLGQAGGLTSDGIINPLDTTVHFSTITKTYNKTTAIDDTTHADEDKTQQTLTKVQNLQSDKDTVNVDIDTSKSSFDTPDRGDKTHQVTYTFTLSGDEAKDYNLTNASYTTDDKGNRIFTITVDGNTINPYKLTDNDIAVVFNPDITKVYDATNSVAYDHTDETLWGTQTGSAEAKDYLKSLTIYGTGFELGKDYTISGATYASENAGSQGVNYTLTLQGDKLNNFDFSGLSADVYANGAVKGHTTGTITQKQISAALTQTPADSTITKVYNGQKNVLVNNADALNPGRKIALSGLIASDVGKVTVDAQNSTASYQSKDVEGDGMTWTDNDGNVHKNWVNYTVQLAGDHKDNYVIYKDGRQDNTLKGAGTITPKALSLQVTNNTLNRQYNAKTAVASGVINNDNITVGGLVSGEGITLDLSGVTGEYGTNDSTKAHFVADGNVNATNGTEAEKAKSILLTGLTLDGAQTTGDGTRTSNYTLDDTAFFSVDDNKGTITRLPLKEGDIDDYLDHVTKEYDNKATLTSAQAEKYFHIEVRKGAAGNEEAVPISHTGSAAFDNGQKDVISDAGVTYTLDSIKPEAFINFKMDSDLLSKYKGKTYTARGTITPRKLYMAIDSTEKNPVTKTYDGTTKIKGDLSGQVHLYVTDETGKVIDLTTKVTADDINYGDKAKLTLNTAYASPDVARDKDGNVTQQAVNYTFGIGGNGKSGNYAFYQYDADKGTITDTALTNNVLADDLGGLINPRELTLYVADGTFTRTYDGTPDIDVKGVDDVAKKVYLDGLQNGDEDLTLDYSRIKGTYGTNDSKQGSFTANGDVNGNELAKSVELTGLQDALNHATSQKGTKGTNYTFTTGNTKVYTVADNKGKITRKHLTDADIKADFAAISKTYDNSNQVAYNHTDTQVWGTDTGSKTAYDYLNGITLGGIALTHSEAQGASNDYDVKSAVYDSENAGTRQVTYQIKLADNIANDYDFSQVKADHYQAGTLTEQHQGTINKKTVLAELTNPKEDIRKTYDSTWDAQYTDGKIALKGLITGDDTSLDTDAVNAHYASKNVVYAGGQPAQQTVFYTAALKGDHAGNYIINPDQQGKAQTTLTGVGTITPRDLVLKFGNQTKWYDGTTAIASQTTVDWLNLKENGTKEITYDTDLYHAGRQGSDDISLVSSIKGNFSDAAVGDDKDVTYTGIALKDDTIAGNYRLVDAQGNALKDGTAYGKGNITPYVIADKQYVVSLDPEITKTYDQTDKVNDATSHIKGQPFIDLNGNGKYDAADGEMLLKYDPQAVQDQAHYATKDSHKGKLQDVTYTFGVQNQNSNFDFVSQLTDGVLTRTTKGRINPLSITAKLVNPAISKTYDGSTQVLNADGSERTGEQLLHFEGVLSGDEAQIVNTSTAAYTDKHAGTGKDVVYTLRSVGDNYLVTQVYDAQGKALSMLTVDDKQDGGTLPAAVGQGTILQRVLTFNPLENNKVYDGTTAAPALTGGSFGNLVAGETLTPDVKVVAGTYGSGYDGKDSNTFTPDANVRRDTQTGDVLYKDVRYTNLQQALAGATGTGQISDYSIADTAYFDAAAKKGKIMPLAITADAIHTVWGSISKEYDGTTTVTGGKTTAGVQTSDPTQLLNLYYQSTVGDKARIDIGYTLNDDGANYTQKDHGTGLTVNYSLKGITEPDFAGTYGNYTFDDAVLTAFQNKTLSTNTGEITQKVLTPEVLSTTGQNKIYDGTTVADNTNVQVAGIVASDQGTVKPTIVAYYDSKNAGDRKVSYTVTLDGNDKGNYVLSGADTDGTVQLDDAATGTIAKRKVTASVTGDATGIDKVYDGTTDVKQSIGSLVSVDAATSTTGLVSGDDVSLDTAAIKGSYDSADVNRDAQNNITTRTVSFTNLNLVGDDAANYELTDTDLTGTGTITPYSIEVSIKDAPTKTYDNSTAIEGTYATMNNISVDKASLIGSDTLNVTLVTDGDDAPHYDTKHADTGLGVNYKLAWDNGNYTLVHTQTDSNDTQTAKSDNQAQTTALHADNGVITGRVLTTSVIDEATKVYDGTKTVSGAEKHISIGNLADGDSISKLNLSVTGTYSSANAADNESDASTQRDVTYSMSIYNTDYLLDTSTQTGKGTISRKGLTVVADPVKRVQNGALPTSYTGKVNGLVSGGTGSASDFTFATDPAAGVTSAVPGTYGIYGWYQNRTSDNYGTNYTFAQDDSNSTALEIFNMKEYHDRKVPLDNVLPQNAGMAQTNSTNFGEFYREPNAAVAYQNGGKTVTLNGGGTYTDVNSSQQDSKASVMNGTGSYSTAAQIGGSQIIGSIGVQDVGVINIDDSGILNLGQSDIAVETTDAGTVRGIASGDDEQQKNYSDASGTQAQHAGSSQQGSASLETVGSGVNVAG